MAHIFYVPFTRQSRFFNSRKKYIPDFTKNMGAGPRRIGMAGKRQTRVSMGVMGVAPIFGTELEQRRKHQVEFLSAETRCVRKTNYMLLVLSGAIGPLAR